MGNVVPLPRRKSPDAAAYNRTAQAVAAAYLGKLSIYGTQDTKDLRYQMSYRRLDDRRQIAVTFEFTLDGHVKRVFLLADDHPGQTRGQVASMMMRDARIPVKQHVSIGEAIALWQNFIEGYCPVRYQWEVWEYFLQSPDKTGWVREADTPSSL